MSPTTTALISYWHRLPADDPVIRRLNLATLCEEVRAGRRAPEALVTAAIGDIDADVVHAATRTYLEGSASGPPWQRAAAITAALEWVSRGLALNRGAVFAVLLSTGDAAVLERLATQRLTLSVEEVATVCRRLPPAPAKSIDRFLREWVELLEGSEDPSLARQRAMIAAELTGRHTEIAPLAAA